MATYIICEMQNLNSYRKGEEIQAKNLLEAKHYAEENQIFQQTVLEIQNALGERIATKEWGEDWDDNYLFE